MKVAILGGGGCFAQNFANYLSGFGIKRFGIGRSKRPQPFWKVNGTYEYHVGRIDQPVCLNMIIDEEPDFIVNFAAQGEGAASFGPYAPDFYSTNVWALSRLVDDLRSLKCLHRFIHIGSSEVYGSNEHAVTEDAPLRPSSPYAVSKAAFDQHLQIMHKVHGFPMNIIRPSNCYCPGQQLHRIIPKAILCALKGKKLPLQGGGRARKSYLHATDLSDAIHRVMLTGKNGATYNVGPPEPVAIRDVVAQVASVMKVDFNELVEQVPDRVGQDGCYWLNSTELRRDTAWSQVIRLPDGIREVERWIRQNPELLHMPDEYIHRA
jgi:dTDP-glucose 4,6-dehydratase